uniref:sugar phosphate isomerase/epimerase family protein n=1 Tax=uncultured Draconibacterium sp. TaxID=1573823 RepID=UPI003217E328
MNRIKKHTAHLIVLVLICVKSSVGVEKSKKHDWKLGVQTASFHLFTFQEAIDKTAELGLSYAEFYYGQKLGGDMEGTMDFRMDEAKQKKILAYAKSKNVKLIASGVVICKDEAEWEQLFKFANYMDIKAITCEPDYECLKYIDELANKYNIDVPIHNHPKPSNYRKPEMFLKAVEGLSNRIGACADVGHWKRVGLDPVKGLKKYEGRLKSLHFKDVKEKEEGEAE